MNQSRLLLTLAVAVSLGTSTSSPLWSDESVTFNEDILPILSDRCFPCHGPDSAARKARLRLDREEEAKKKRASRELAPITPGHADRSAVFLRMVNDDADELMPPPDSKLSLTKSEIAKIRAWIDGGAKWEGHWAFLAPKKETSPTTGQADQARDPLDHYILDRLESTGLEPSPPADPAHLLRRVTFDLTGLPPALGELDGFLADPSDANYANAVDRLLASPHFGERMAQEWLDVARYGDTDGLFEDHPRSIWAWRDWVVESFNKNLPYDRFITWQIAGDLLPSATEEQKIATGFLRNNPTSNEGGLIDEDYRIKYLIDRVNTTATAFLGLTLECAQCHDHKFDPLSQREYFEFAAFFNSLVGRGNTKGATSPVLRLLPPEKKARLVAIGQELAPLEKRGKDANADEKKRIEALKKEKTSIEKSAVVTMIAADEAKPRKTFRLMRGEYDKPAEEVRASAPASVLPYPKDYPKNRLGLARWMTHRDNPLTARVVVNRYWQLLFGTGIVRTSEDFGSQGERASHRALLDHLTVDFVESGWDVKKLLRRIVLSSTYRQSSALRPGHAERDPGNRLLARAPRSRLPAEILRDHALAVSGLLVRKLGGPGVHPYQPAVLFGRNAIGAAGASFRKSSGEGLYRRSLYTYWKRQIPAANIRILGGDGRTACRTRRERTNTPLQALVLLNDPQFVEAARVLAERTMREGGKTPAERIGFAFRLATSRRASARELEILLAELDDRRREFTADAKAAAAYLAGGGDRKPPKEHDVAVLAAYAAVCSLILNLDEAISKS